MDVKGIQPTAYAATAAQAIDQLIADAVRAQASDIHLEPSTNDYRVRYRIDGLLTITQQLPLNTAQPIVIRLKVMAGLDISEQRLPQDGGCQVALPHPLDLRISTCPTIYGEKIVLRLLKTQSTHPKIEQLGLIPEQQNVFMHALDQPQGMIIVTGPTGSGKTVTLYSALQQLNQTKKNICTVEDPVEIKMSGINQTQIQPKAGLDFITMLRSLLRQDPDIIMIGEIRDKETAEIALKAAQTGHLVLTTLHTNSAIAAISRLKQMGIGIDNIANAIHLIIAQRLVRKLCLQCRRTTSVREVPNEKTLLGNTCEQCNQGYQGRTGIFELLPMSTTLNDMILQTTNSTNLQKKAEQEGFITLKNAALTAVQQGLTDLTEVYRVIGDTTI